MNEKLSRIDKMLSSHPDLSSGEARALICAWAMHLENDELVDYSQMQQELDEFAEATCKHSTEVIDKAITSLAEACDVPISEFDDPRDEEVEHLETSLKL